MRDPDSDPPPIDDGRALSHEARIQQLILAALPDPEQRLRIGSEMARGGMGAVRFAFDSRLQRRMAAKTMHASTYDHLMLVHGFLREAQVTWQLDHPNIVPIHELGRDANGELYFTMKLVEGQSLKQLIGGAPALDSDRLLNLLEIFLKICDGLGFAHARGVLHCDLKSANVMVGEFGQVYLMDWGGAQLLRPKPGVDTHAWVRDSLPPLPAEETQGMVFGTPAYMSPEQASAGSEPMDERSDIFSMGALLYEIMTGRPPYQASTAMEAVLLAQLCDVRPPDELPHLPPNLFARELVRIVMRALARQPDERYATIAAMKLDLLRFLRGGGNFATIRMPRGAHVIRQGEVGDAAYIVVSGQLEVFKHIDDERISLRMLGPGDMFGETAIFAASPRTASVVVLADASLVVVTSEVIEQELASMKPWMGAFIRTLASRFGGVEEERRARSHSGPSVSALSVVRPNPGAPLPARAAPAQTVGGMAPAVPQDRADITVIADLMAEDRDGSDSVVIDVSNADDSMFGTTLVTQPGSADESEVMAAADDDSATQLISPHRPPLTPGS